MKYSINLLCEISFEISLLWASVLSGMELVLSEMTLLHEKIMSYTRK
jgi:hypothetical protein